VDDLEIYDATNAGPLRRGHQGLERKEKKKRERERERAKLKSDREAPVRGIAFPCSLLSGVTWMAETSERKI
jgi:hypothetical protein